MAKAPRYGRDTTQRRRLRQLVAARGEPCWRCGMPIDYGAPAGVPEAFVLGHIKPLSQFPELAYDPANVAAEHNFCNASAGDRMEHQSIGTNSRRW